MQFKKFNFYLKLATDSLTAEEHRLALEKAAFGRILAEVKEFNDDQTPEPLVMDVGGKLFHTHTKTLHHGMLAAMVSDGFRLAGDFFIDRDPKWFALVLHSLRSSSSSSSRMRPEDTQSRNEMDREMQYYNLVGLKQKQKQIIVIGHAFPCIYNDHRASDQILCQRLCVGGSQGWEKYHAPPPNHDGRWFAGDGLLFVFKDREHRPQSPELSNDQVLKFCAATGSCNYIPTREQIPLHSNWTYHRGMFYGADGHFGKLDVSTGTWTALQQPSQSRFDASLGVVGNRLFVMGGLVEGVAPLDWSATKSVEEYLPSANRWVSVCDLPIAVAKATVVAFNGKLLVIGGIDSDAVLEYNPANDKWKTLPHLLVARIQPAVTVVEDSVVVMGGYAMEHFDSPLQSVERYDTSTDRWESMASLTSQIHEPVAVVI